MTEKVIAAGLLAICPETGRFLMLKRRNNVKYSNYWSLPGGHFEVNDVYPKITAVREFREETGYDGVIKISKQPLCVYKNNHLNFYTYVAILPFEFTPELKGDCTCGNENVDFRWFSVSYKWDLNEDIMPSLDNILQTKESKLIKIINKFKDKNYE